MQRLHRSEIEALNQLIIDAISEIKDIRVDPRQKTWETWEKLYEVLVATPARVDMPLGGLLNPDLWILPAIWDWQGRLHIYSLEQLRQLEAVFTSQGIEGAFWVEMDLNEALNVIDFVPRYRMNISVCRSQLARDLQECGFSTAFLTNH